MNEFICTWGTRPLIITILIILVVCAVSVYLIFGLTKRYKLKGKNNNFVFFCLVFAYLLPVVLVLPFLYMPLKISVTSEMLAVKQIKGEISIPISEIIEIRKVQKGELKNCIKRTVTVGGLFGYLGKFENQQLGKFQMYVTDTKNRFIVKTKNQVYIFSCENRDELIQIINNQIDNK